MRREILGEITRLHTMDLNEHKELRDKLERTERKVLVVAASIAAAGGGLGAAVLKLLAIV